MTRGTEFIRTRVPAVCAWSLVIALAGPAAADRHCSFARESAFYARELSAEASRLPVVECPARMAQALDRLRDARTELEICSCAPAEESLERWFKIHPAGAGESAAACRKDARTINAISIEVLTEVEKCF